MKKGIQGCPDGNRGGFLVAAGYFIGYKTAYDSVENMGAAQAADQQTFTRRFVKGKPAVFW